MAPKPSRKLAPWIDVLAIAGWGALFLKYWATGKLYLLIHPNYFWLTIAAGASLVVLAIWRALVLLKQSRSRTIVPATPHLALFPPGFSSALLLLVAIAGLVVPPRAFASQTAIDRGVNDSLTLTRVRPQSFAATTKSEDKTIIDWIRTLTVYPEPDAYKGQKARVQGFVIHSPNLAKEYLLISRFVLTCCAADAYPISLPVKLPAGQTRDQYKPDSWQEVEGQMATETLAGKRQMTIAATSLKSIPEPKNPYDY